VLPEDHPVGPRASPPPRRAAPPTTAAGRGTGRVNDAPGERGGLPAVLARRRRLPRPVRRAVGLLPRPVRAGRPACGRRGAPGRRRRRRRRAPAEPVGANYRLFPGPLAPAAAAAGPIPDGLDAARTAARRRHARFLPAARAARRPRPPLPAAAAAAAAASGPTALRAGGVPPGGRHVRPRRRPVAYVVAHPVFLLRRAAAARCAGVPPPGRRLRRAFQVREPVRAVSPGGVCPHL
ncbi:MAG: hypothetical protein BJ554DRAFT_1531, partial [Olpidium bornovanus]